MDPHFTDEEAEAQGTRDLPKIKCLASSKAQLQSQADATARASHHLPVTSQTGSHRIKSVQLK